MAKDKNQSEGRRENAAVPAWEITKGAGKAIQERKTGQPDQSTQGKPPAPR
jgi:hypothetical protein